MTPTVIEARAFKCPVARTFAEKVVPHCDGPGCILWRWVPLSAGDPRFKAAIQSEMARMAAEDGKRPAVSLHKQAVERVSAAPADFGLPVGPERGYCGLGGRPE